jgi:hypothetical protein
MSTNEDMSEMKVRVALLEAAHLDNTNKITTLIEGFNTLNINLSSLITSINTAIRTTFIGATFASMMVGGIWAYYTFSVNQSVQSQHQISQQLGKNNEYN